MPYEDTEIRDRLRWLIRTRWVGCLSVFVVAHFLRALARLTFPLLPVYLILGFVAVYNSWFQLRLRTLSDNNLKRNIIEQIVLDYFALSVAAYFTGGYESPFLSYLVFHIGISGVLLDRKGTFKVSAIAIVFIGALMGLLHLGILPRVSIFADMSIVYSNLYVMFAYGSVFASTLLFTAYFITYLSEHLHEKQRELKRINVLTEKLRSSIYLEDVMSVLMDSILSHEGVAQIKYFSLDKSGFSLVHRWKGADTLSEENAPEAFIPLTDSNIFVETFLSCVACMVEVSKATSEYEKKVFGLLFKNSRTVVILPVWSSFRKKCYEYFNCAYFDCPAFGSQDTRCWTMPATMCSGEKATSLTEKLRECIDCDLFFPTGLLLCNISRNSKHDHVIDFDVMISILDAASLAISNARLYEKTLELSELDGLTGIKNRRAFFKTLNAEYARSKRYKRQFSVLMIDIDDFKHYNDLYGHPQGDILLKMLTRTLQYGLRETDSIGRYGGEEFIVLLPEMGESEAVCVAERVRSAVCERNSVAQPNARITISVGVSCYPEHGENTDDIIKAADSALYLAKTSGKNRVIDASHVREYDEGTLGI